MSHYTLNTKNWNYVFAFLAIAFILSSGVSTVYAAPNSPPTLKLVKSVITDDGGSAEADDWFLRAISDASSEIFSNDGGSGVFMTVDSGAPITLSELEGPEGYDDDVIWFCNGGNFQPPNIITLSEGDKVTCTISSDDIAPTLKLVKEVINLDGGQATADLWTLSASASNPNQERNISGTGTLNPDDTASIESSIFANVVYDLAESGGPSGYTDLNDGKWRCTITFSNGSGFSVPKTVGISLKEGDTAVCTITNVQDEPSVSIEIPSKINGKLTLSAEVKGFEDTVPVNFKVYKMNGSEKSMVYEGYVSAAPYSFSVPARVLDGGSSYEVTANASDENGKSASTFVMVNIPAKGNH